MKNQEKLNNAKLEDLFRLCLRSHEPKFSVFLDPAEQQDAEPLLRRADLNLLLFGGYADAGRKMLGVFPEWQEPLPELFPLCVLKITKTYDKELSHRDYLGTILSQGIERNRVGDILVTDFGAYLFLAKGIERALTLSKVAGCGVKSEIVPLSEISVPAPKFKAFTSVAASLRLDAVVAAALNESRKNAAALIASERVSVNHRIRTDGARALSPGDLLSIRGKGRILLEQIGENTRSGRIHLHFKKYI